MNPLLKVSTIMTKDPVTITPSESLGQAKALFEEKGIHHLPVVNTEGELVGILSQSDFLRAHEREVYSVGDLMTRGLAKVDVTDTVRTAASVFSLNKFHALPVMDDGQLVGVLTTHDLIRLLDSEKVQLSDYADA